MTRALTIDEAAYDLRVSRRWLEYWLTDHPVDAAGNLHMSSVWIETLT